MLYEIRAFNIKETVFRVILDPLDVDILNRALDNIDTETICIRDETEEEKLNHIMTIAKALRAIESVGKGAQNE